MEMKDLETLRLLHLAESVRYTSAQAKRLGEHQLASFLTAFEQGCSYHHRQLVRELIEADDAYARAVLAGDDHPETGF